MAKTLFLISAGVFSVFSSFLNFWGVDSTTPSPTPPPAPQVHVTMLPKRLNTKNGWTQVVEGDAAIPDYAHYRVQDVRYHPGGKHPVNPPLSLIVHGVLHIGKGATLQSPEIQITATNIDFGDNVRLRADDAVNGQVLVTATVGAIRATGLGVRTGGHVIIDSPTTIDLPLLLAEGVNLTEVVTINGANISAAGAEIRSHGVILDATRGSGSIVLRDGFVRVDQKGGAISIKTQSPGQIDTCNATIEGALTTSPEPITCTP